MKKLIYIMWALLSFSSCNNWLDVELDNKVDDSKLFDSKKLWPACIANCPNKTYMDKHSPWNTWTSWHNIIRIRG